MNVADAHPTALCDAEDRRVDSASVTAALIGDAPFLAVASAFVATGLLLQASAGFPDSISIDISSWTLLVQWTVVYAVAGAVALLGFRLTRDGESLKDLDTWKGVGAEFLRPERLVPFLVACLLMPPFMSVFVAFKTSIPDLVPFTWDARFMEWDRILHLGRHPWEILQPWLGRPALTRMLDYTYYTWFPVVWLTMLWQLWHGSAFSNYRRQFLLAFALSWILLGTVMATGLSSVGPVYYEAVMGDPEPFAPLMSYIRSVDAAEPLTAVMAQNLLWQSYVDPSVAQVEGISAMPSMHVAMVTLLVLVGFRVNRWVGTTYLLYALLILLGSVSLGWHYAIDGYAAAIGAIAIWWASGRFVGWWQERSRQFLHETRAD